jgi:hypothetical protein
MPYLPPTLGSSDWGERKNLLEICGHINQKQR